MSDINKKILKEISISMKKIIEYIDEKSTKVVSKQKIIEEIPAGLKTEDCSRNTSINRWCESLRN
tara:strand:- start:124 stop:318 length:195 start_codon:yes stop_codon:yes gene_type:complete